MEKRKRAGLVLGTVMFAVVTLLGVVSCARPSATPTLPAPAQAVQDLLELRAERSTDASAYAKFFESVEIAESLAKDASATAETTAAAQPPIPEWERPYLSAQTSATADVVVVWIPDRRFKDWATATVFNTRKQSGAWKIVDARSLTTTPPPELGSGEGTGTP